MVRANLVVLKVVAVVAAAQQHREPWHRVRRLDERGDREISRKVEVLRVVELEVLGASKVVVRRLHARIERVVGGVHATRDGALRGLGGGASDVDPGGAVGPAVGVEGVDLEGHARGDEGRAAHAAAEVVLTRAVIERRPVHLRARFSVTSGDGAAQVGKPAGPARRAGWEGGGERRTRL
jgi:hypothetical protein